MKSWGQVRHVGYGSWWAWDFVWPETPWNEFYPLGLQRTYLDGGVLYDPNEGTR